MRTKTAYVMLFVLAFGFPFGCIAPAPTSSANVSWDSLVPKLATVDDVIQWSEKNLHFKNVNPWDPAPEITSVIKDGYGDCKMLAGVVSVLLDSVGKKNLFIVIKDKTWHMFNAYEEDGKWRIVNNARLVKNVFESLDETKSFSRVSRFENTFDNYEEFRRWFNEEIYPRRGR